MATQTLPPVYDPVDDIVICFDGTWCGEATGTTGNIRILADILASQDKDAEWGGMERAQSHREKSHADKVRGLVIGMPP